MLRNRRWATTFHIIIAGDADGWCQKWLVWSIPHTRPYQTFHPILAVKLLGIMLRNRCWATIFHTITTGDAGGWCRKWLVWSTPHTQSHQTLCLVPTVKLLGIMLKSRCEATTFHISTAGDANRWCQKWPVWSTPHTPITPNFPPGCSHEIVGDYAEKYMLKPPLFTFLQLEMLTDDARSGRCDQPLKPGSHQTFRTAPTMKFLARCWRMVLEVVGVINPSAKELRNFIQWGILIIFFLGVSAWISLGWQWMKRRPVRGWES